MTGLLTKLCEAYGIPVPVAEYRFAPPRRWRWDWCWVEARLALEIQGGLFTRGRHVRGAALVKEHEKLNAGACLGWRVLFCQPKDLESGAAFELVARALKA